jgi:fluoride exporter
MGLNSIFLVFLGGGIGSVLRFLLSKIIPFQANAFPWATLLSNVLASFILAFVVFQFKDSEKWSAIQALILIGFCGGLSTFSTFSYENFQLLQQGQLALFWFNVLISFGLGLLAFWFLARH